MLRYSLSRRLTWVVFAFLVGLPALASAVLNKPKLDPVSSDRSSITVQVTAGSSGAPAGFELQWMTRADYNAHGQTWPTNAGDPAILSCLFTGQPTLTRGGGATTYQLPSNTGIYVDLGNLFDETGVDTYYTSELTPGTEYVLRSRALASGSNPASQFSLTLFTSTQAPGVGCVLTQGFWKTHPEDWPVSSLTLGTVVYTQAQLLDILNTPAQGNGLIFLAHQLIAAKLNIAAGADGSSVATTIADADALIDGLVIPPIGSGFIDPADASGLTETLDQFNNGNLGVPHCTPVAAELKTWSQIKSSYR
jgi:hypothetical protein